MYSVLEVLTKVTKGQGPVNLNCNCSSSLCKLSKISEGFLNNDVPLEIFRSSTLIVFDLARRASCVHTLPMGRRQRCGIAQLRFQSLRLVHQPERVWTGAKSFLHEIGMNSASCGCRSCQPGRGRSLARRAWTQAHAPWPCSLEDVS